MDFARLAVRAGLMLALVSGLAACAYPSEPRYSIHANQGGAVPGPPPPPPGTYTPPPATWEDGSALPPTNPYTEVPPPVRAPTESIEGGALDFPTSPVAPAVPAPVTPPAPRPSTAAGVAYEIQAGDTISGVGRRFGTPVQTLIDLNSLGPRGAITPGQRIRLPDNAIDRGHDPYATGPSPIGVEVVEGAAPPPPPPPPPSGNAPMPPRTETGSVSLAWPLRGDIVRRFGAVGVSERNNGVNIAAVDGTEVRASAAGRVGYVGDDLAGQGMTVLIVHRDGWRTVYGHLGGRPTVRDGEEVTAGQVIGRVGNTAGDGRPSIHFEVWRMRGDSPAAVDPLTVLPR